MNAETIHDALTLLPADLVAQADRWRSRKRARYRWVPALAACLALVVSLGVLPRAGLLGGSGGASGDSAMVYSAQRNEAALDEECAAITSDTPRDSGAAADQEAGAPAADIEAAATGTGSAVAYAETPDSPDSAAERSDETRVSLLTSRQELESYLTEWETFCILDDLEALCVGYDESWFESSDLVLLAVRGVSQVSVNATEWTESGLTIRLQSAAGDTSTSWHIAVPVSKGSLTGAEAVTVEQTGE